MAKRKSKPDEEEQKKRFIEKARELKADETGEMFERSFKKIVKPKRQTIIRKAKPRP